MTYEHYFTKGFSCLTYGLHEREVLLDYKYNGKSWLGGKLGDILYDRISCENIQPDVIIPVPISAGRAKKRGYNQSALMGKRLSNRWGVPMDESLLIRAKDTQLLRSLNPAERRLALEDAFVVPAKKIKNVAIIGGGIGGMEAAILCAKRGHKVTLYEKSDKLGGVFIAAAAPSFKEKDRDLIKWYIREIAKHPIEVKMNTEVKDIASLNADEVVVAKMNGGFFNMDGSTEYLGTFVDEGKYYNPAILPDNNRPKLLHRYEKTWSEYPNRPQLFHYTEEILA